VSTDQYIYEISKPTYDSVYLQSVELADLKATKPAAARVKLNSNTGAEAEKPLAPHLAFLNAHKS
jgi:hypothetical protein